MSAKFDSLSAIKTKTILRSLFVVALCLLVCAYGTNLFNEIPESAVDVNRLIATLRDNDIVFKDQQAQIQLLQSKLLLKQASPPPPQAQPQALPLLSKAEIETTQRMLDKIPNMQSDLKRLSLQLLTLKYGKSATIYVDMYLHFPADAPTDVRIVRCQMADSEVMPYTVLFFLEQVSLGLWSDTVFIRAASHVLQADPRGPTKPLAKFTQNKLKSVAFQEYNPSYPHVKYSMGLAGRPGGPDFYLSIIDNKKNHGPGGQSSYAIANEADPCFGKVISGFEHLVRMKSLPTKEGHFKMLEEFVDIVKMEIIVGDGDVGSGEEKK